jgi:hypothetical protein
MTTFHGRLGEDDSCILEYADHPVISHKSWIFYARSFALSEKQLEHQIRTGMVEVFPDPCSTELFARILLGAGKSRHTPNKIRVILKCQGLI